MAGATVLGLSSSALAANVFRSVLATPVYKGTVSLTAGQTYTIETQNLAAGVDTVLYLHGPDASGTTRGIAYNDDYAGSYRSRITVVAPQTALYTIVVHAYSPATVGTGDVFVNGSSIASGVTFGGHSVGVPSGNYRYETALAPGGSTDTMTYAVGCDGNLLGWDDDGGVGYASRVAATTACRIVVGSYYAGANGFTSLYANDCTSANDPRDADHDGLGGELERALGTCDTVADPGCSAVVNTTDTDHDGIPDAAEVFGIDDASAPQHLPRWGADPRHKDVFVEVDYIAPYTTNPISDAMAAQLQGFLNAGKAGDLLNPDGADGVRVHLDVGREPVDPAQRTLLGNWGGSNLSAQTDYTIAPNTNRSAVRSGVFRYALVSDGPGGGQTDGDRFGAGVGPSAGILAFAHELGHTMGLEHEGHWKWGAINNKPNYHSLMNYAYAYSGVGYSQGLDPSVLNPAAVSEETSYPSYSPAYLTSGPYNFIVNGNTVDWNRDTYTMDFGWAGNSGTVRAAITWGQVHDESPMLNATKLTVGSADTPAGTTPAYPNPTAATPRLVRLGSYLYAFYVNSSQRIIYKRAVMGQADANGSCPGGGAIGNQCATWSQPAGVPTLLNATGVSAVAYKSGITIAYRTTDGVLRTLGSTVQGSDGTLSGYTGETWHGLTSTEPELSIMYLDPGAYGAPEQLGLFWVDNGSYRWSVTRVDGTWWDRGNVRRTDASVVTGNLSPAIIPWPSRALSTSNATSGRACGAFVAPNNEVRFLCYDKTVDGWQDLTSTIFPVPSQFKSFAKPALAYHVLRDGNAKPLFSEKYGQFWLVTIDANGYAYVSTTNGMLDAPNANTRFRWSAGFGDEWTTLMPGVGVSLFEDGTISALKALFLYPTSGVYFLPFADGTVNVTAKDGNDFQVIEQGTCWGIQGQAMCGGANKFGY